MIEMLLVILKILFFFNMEKGLRAYNRRKPGTYSSFLALLKQIIVNMNAASVQTNMINIEVQLCVSCISSSCIRGNVSAIFIVILSLVNPIISSIGVNPKINIIGIV